MLRGKQRKNIKINAILILISLSFLYLSCKSVEKKTYIHARDHRDNETLISASTNYKTYKLKKFQDYDFEQRFRNSVENSFIKTAEKYNQNFTYSIKPQGAVYPFSEVDIICVTDSRISLSKANEICAYFFSTLDNDYEKLKGEIK